MNKMYAKRIVELEKKGVKKRRMKCPKCGEQYIAEIIYGYICISGEIQSKLDKKEYTLGGCCVTDKNWECNVCYFQW